MKKVMLSVLAIAFAATAVMGNGHVKNVKVKHATCTHCPPGQKCTPATCTTPDCCK